MEQEKLYTQEIEGGGKKRRCKKAGECSPKKRKSPKKASPKKASPKKVSPKRKSPKRTALNAHKKK